MESTAARRLIVAGAFAGLLVSVWGANYLVRHVGIVRVWPTGLYAPAGVYMHAGPSEDYKALLRGEISAAEYVRRLKRDVNARLKMWRLR